ncbi:Heavy metal-associated isoprenylated plant protein 8 [Citrus sinensis]|nr:Heavy metal-associated isoprenylated plant protein 8 [Citrus sinensis]
MHCDGCATKVAHCLHGFDGVEKVKLDRANNKPQVKVVILKMYMHCEGCARDIKKNIARIDGVLTVEPDMSKSQVTVKGEFDPPKLAEAITKRLGKFVEIVKEEAAKSKKNHKKDNENNMMHYPPQHPFNKNFYSCLSDEAIHSCFVM